MCSKLNTQAIKHSQNMVTWKSGERGASIKFEHVSTGQLWPSLLQWVTISTMRQSFWHSFRGVGWACWSAGCFSLLFYIICLHLYCICMSFCGISCHRVDYGTVTTWENVVEMCARLTEAAIQKLHNIFCLIPNCFTMTKYMQTYNTFYLLYILDCFMYALFSILWSVPWWPL